MVKRLSQTNEQAPTRRQIDAYKAARNEEFESKIKKLKQQLKVHKAGLKELREKKSRLDGVIKLNAEAIKQMDSKALSHKALGIKLEGTKNSLSASNAELQLLERKSKDIVNKIKLVEKELETLGNKFFKKQQREKCESLLSDLRNQKNQIDSEKLSQANSIQALQQLVLEYEKQIKFRSDIERGKKDIQNLEGKINTKEKAVNSRQKDLRDLNEEFIKENSLDESLLVLKVTEFTVKQRQLKLKQKNLAERKLQQEKLIRQAKIREFEKNIQRLELFLVENSSRVLEKKLSEAESVVQKLERKKISLEGSIDRWIESKFRQPYWKGKSPKQILWDLKRNRQLKYYLPLNNMVAKQDELLQSLKDKKISLSEIKKQKQEINIVSEQLAKLKNDLRTLEKIQAALSSGSRKGPLPRMDIENWSDAELFAEKYMKWLGFADAKRTGAGADEGKDVDSRKAIAQVKDMGTGASRPMLQQLNGVAAAERKIPIFFARSYATTAKEWGEKHGIALFQFSLRGEVKAVSKKAKELLEGV